MTFDELSNKLAAVEQELAELERKYRARLWLGHGHPFHALYGDDGEMQCQLCMPYGFYDYLRTPLSELEDAQTKILIDAAEQALSESKPR